jgi:hypothetical protein
VGGPVGCPILATTQSPTTKDHPGVAPRLLWDRRRRSDVTLRPSRWNVNVAQRQPPRVGCRCDQAVTRRDPFSLAISELHVELSPLHRFDEILRGEVIQVALRGRQRRMP